MALCHCTVCIPIRLLASAPPEKCRLSGPALSGYLWGWDSGSIPVILMHRKVWALSSSYSLGEVTEP